MIRFGGEEPIQDIFMVGFSILGVDPSSKSFDAASSLLIFGLSLFQSLVCEGNARPCATDREPSSLEPHQDEIMSK